MTTDWTSPWRWLALASIVAIGAVDAFLADIARSYFSTGFNTVYLDGVFEIGTYVLGSAVFDFTMIIGIWAVVLPTSSAMRFSRLQVYCLAAVFAVGLPLAVDLARYHVYQRLGGMVSFYLLGQLSGGSASEMTAQAAAQAAPFELIVPVLAVIASASLVIGARRLERRTPDLVLRLARPRTRFLWISFVGLALVSTLILSLAPGALASRIRYGLALKSSTFLVTQLADRLSDIDRDGFGLVSMPSDPAPLDGSIQPYALDVPGNGVDENGLAGDHPQSFDFPGRVASSRRQGDIHPPLLLIFLESFRADLLDLRWNDREVTPFLNRLAREGALSLHTYAHTPLTARSRAQLFGGRLVPFPGQDTLIDDFGSRGYRVVYVSGQDDAFGGSEALVGVDRADSFYDARQDRERRSTRTATPSSLQVGWRVVVERARSALREHVSKQPLFLYVNVVDSHFPYFAERGEPLLDLLGVDAITREDIRSDRAPKVWAAYLNAVANVDRAVETLVGHWRERYPERETAILVTADHGQSFYDGGVLGHGQTLDARGTRVPLITVGIGGDWPEPIGLADIRGLLRANLGVTEHPGRARFAARPGKAVLQFIPGVGQPRQIALRSNEGALHYRFNEDRLANLGPDDARLPAPSRDSDEFRTLIWSWEAAQHEKQAERAKLTARNRAK